MCSVREGQLYVVQGPFAEARTAKKAMTILNHCGDLLFRAVSVYTFGWYDGAREDLQHRFSGDCGDIKGSHGMRGWLGPSRAAPRAPSDPALRQNSRSSQSTNSPCLNKRTRVAWPRRISSFAQVALLCYTIAYQCYRSRNHGARDQIAAGRRFGRSDIAERDGGTPAWRLGTGCWPLRRPKGILLTPYDPVGGGRLGRGRRSGEEVSQRAA